MKVKLRGCSPHPKQMIGEEEVDVIENKNLRIIVRTWNLRVRFKTLNNLKLIDHIFELRRFSSFKVLFSIITVLPLTLFCFPFIVPNLR